MADNINVPEKLNEKARFPFYRAFWVGVLIWAVIASACVPLIQSVVLGGGPYALPLVWAGGVFLVAYFWLRSYCEFREGYLVVAVGPFFEKYEYRQITGIKTTMGIWARGEAPRPRFALYVNRVLKRYLSPRDVSGFLKLFKEKCPDAQVD